METNRTIEILKTYNFAQKNHWQLMCDLSNNDYDIHYFDGRQTANITLEDFLQDQEDFNINRIIEFLIDKFEEYVEEQIKFYRENKCYNEFYRGLVSEFDLLIKIAKQNYN